MKKTVALILVVISLVIGSASAQAIVDTDSHDVTVNLPVVLRLVVDATNVIFDFTTDPATDTSDGLERAGITNYVDFLEGTLASQDFAPSSYAGASNDWVNARVVTNQPASSLHVVSAGTLGGALKMSVEGSSYAVPAAGQIMSMTGAGRHDVEIRFAYSVNATDTVDGTATPPSTSVNYKVTAP